ncbi:GntP family permease [Robiginitalea aurantiaca]|uniref:SLC13 family permease n=1 Tax=Robiginitalea aurantiaca TaxID=3056915 RepID=A0ABT7WEE5_9FLAO|nr:SLC13 family permease [Robiginitalea aurantiaca]MDM9631194.1 SLC13 family permease [Robiginitalea aurantiaca]
MELVYLLVAVLIIIWMTTRLKIHPFLVLLVVSMAYGAFAGMSLESLVIAINEGFGRTMGKIGLIIVLGVMIGAFLEHTGGARAIAEKTLSWIGNRRIPLAMAVLGYIVSIPVFADSGYMLLDPLGKSMSRKAGVSLAGGAIALGLGLMVSHTLVPPTPGPIAAAGILEADLGLVILFGVPVSLLALAVSIWFASRVASKTYIEPEPVSNSAPIPDLVREYRPPVFLALLPIAMPILLIVLKSVFGAKGAAAIGVSAWVNFLGEPVIALMIGLLLCLLLPQKLNVHMLASDGWVGKAIRDSASILLITGAGGIFGTVLQESGIAESLGNRLVTYNLGIFLPFVLAAVLKTAQGSSTVALITAASILFPMMPALGLETEVQKALAVVALGAGSSVISHANDSFFWVVTQMSGMDVRTGYKLFGGGTFLLGTSAAVGVFVCSLLFA